MFQCPVCGTKIQKQRGLTPRQAETLAFIKSFIAKHGWSPSYEEIELALGLSGNKSGAYRLVSSLAKRGHITLTYHQARSITVVGEAEPCGPTSA